MYSPRRLPTLKHASGLRAGRPLYASTNYGRKLRFNYEAGKLSRACQTGKHTSCASLRCNCDCGHR